MIRATQNKSLGYLTIVFLLLSTPLLAAEDDGPESTFGKLIPIIVGVVFYLLAKKKKASNKKIPHRDSDREKVQPKSFSSYAREPLDRDKKIQKRLEKQYKPIEPK